MNDITPPAIVRTHADRDTLAKQAAKQATIVRRTDRVNIEARLNLARTLATLRPLYKSGEWEPFLETIQLTRQRAAEYISTSEVTDEQIENCETWTDVLTVSKNTQWSTVRPDPDVQDNGDSNSPNQEDKDSEESQTPEPPADATNGQAPTEPASPEIILCDTCKRRGSRPDCADCADLRKNTSKKKSPKKNPQTVDEVKDKTGVVVPDSCRDAFADETLTSLIDELKSVSAMFKPESLVTRAGKLTTHYPFILLNNVNEHAYEALHRLQCVVEALQAGVAYAVCPECDGINSKRDNGTCCMTCRGCGHVPEWRYKEIQNEKAMESRYAE